MLLRPTHRDSGPGTLDPGLWTWDSGPGTLDSGLWTRDSGPGTRLWTRDSGPRTLDSGPGTLDSGLWTRDSGPGTLDPGWDDSALESGGFWFPDPEPSLSGGTCCSAQKRAG